MPVFIHDEHDLRTIWLIAVMKRIPEVRMSEVADYRKQAARYLHISIGYQQT